MYKLSYIFPIRIGFPWILHSLRDSASHLTHLTFPSNSDLQITTDCSVRLVCLKYVLIFSQCFITRCAELSLALSKHTDKQQLQAVLQIEEDEVILLEIRFLFWPMYIHVMNVFLYPKVNISNASNNLPVKIFIRIFSICLSYTFKICHIVIY